MSYPPTDPRYGYGGPQGGQGGGDDGAYNYGDVLSAGGVSGGEYYGGGGTYPQQQQQQQQYHRQQQLLPHQELAGYYDEYSISVGGAGGGDAAGYVPDPTAVSFVPSYQDPSIMMPSVASTAYYPPESNVYQDHMQQQVAYDYSEPQPYSGGGGGGWETSGADAGLASSSSPGEYYLEGAILPQLYDHAVSALAYDRSYKCLYISSTTQKVSQARYGGIRASLLLAYATTNKNGLQQQHDQQQGLFLDGGMMYTSVAGHPEAPSTTLQAVYQAMYGISMVVPNVRHLLGVGRGGGGHPPSHSYRPAYGAGGGISMMHQQEPLMASPEQKGHIGIVELLPLDGTDGCVASISPSAVRIHTHGGLQVADHDINGMLCGTIHPHGGGGVAATAGPSHVTVGGLHVDTTSSSSSSSLSTPSQHSRGQSIHCMDLWHGLRTVQSRSFKDVDARKVAVSAMATSHERGSIVAGCTDGKIRLLDASLREMATVRSHLGGVSSVAVSTDGMLIATTGFSSRAKPSTSGSASSSALYAFPDTTVYVYDVRYLGRGGIAHPFTGVKGAPRHLTFMPDIEGFASNRLLVASGRPGGGIQVMTPFELQTEETTSFYVPPLQGDEFITAFSPPEEDELAMGTSLGRVLVYRLDGYQGNKNTLTNFCNKEKLGLPVPPYGPPAPAVSLDPQLLQGVPTLRNGSTDQVRAIFSTYLMLGDPMLTPIGETPEDARPTFDVLAITPITEDIKRNVLPSLLSKAVTGERDYIRTIPTAGLEIDLLANHNVVSTRYKGKKAHTTLPNPNKLLYCPKLTSLIYENGLNARRKQQHSAHGERCNIPSRYQLQTRPGFKSSGAFDPSDSNDSGLFPGWEYGPTMPNAWACPVLLLLYFVPEIRQAVLECQFTNTTDTSSQKSYAKALTPELGFVFHQIESLSRFGLLYPSKKNGAQGQRQIKAKIGAWSPSNFLAFLATMSQAEQLQVLDSSPAAVDRPRRPESFYRFLAYQMDKELDKLSGSSTSTKLMDSLNGLDFVSSNQFIEYASSPPTQSSTRALTLDLNYDIFPPGTENKSVRFGELLQHSLCRETRLRAWNSKSKAFETIIQRRIATSLPKLLTLSCSCAGRKEEDGLWAWGSENEEEPWLPEFVEVELEADGNVVVTDWCNGGKDRSTFRGKSALPPEVSRLVTASSSPQKHLYRLEAVVSHIFNPLIDSEGEDQMSGHHVLHARVPVDYRRRVLKGQAEKARKAASSRSNRDNENATDFVLSSKVSTEDFEIRAKHADEMIATLDKDLAVTTQEESQPYPPIASSSSDWILYNGYKVSKTVVEDARAFHVSFKEPVLVVFQAINKNGNPEQTIDCPCNDVEKELSKLSLATLDPPLLSNVTNTTPGDNRMDISQLENLKEGRPVAFDAEFVSVEEEDSTLNESGQKLVVRETRHTVGRISLLDCKTRTVALDDHVLPRERVVDYLTRFSGIVADDLDPIRTTHRLISTRSAYLEMRYLQEQGCIFVGHGLKQDFSTLNLVVPPYQILDTVELFHQPGMRYISLRFLANYVLGRDMQQDVHDSIEDARAAHDLFEKAKEWKREGVWDKKIQELYSHGEKTSWKIGVDDPP